MVVIAVEGFPLSVSLNQVPKLLSKSVKGYLKPINFLQSDCKTFKTCYVELSENLDPLKVISRINEVQKRKHVFRAFLPETIPDFPPKPVILHKILRKKLGIPAGEINPKQILSVAHLEIICELQFKYPVLCNFSMKTSHRLLQGIGKTVRERLETIVAPGGNYCNDPRLLVERYRKFHPHFGDFELIRSTLHSQEAAAGESLTELQEFDLTNMEKSGKPRIRFNWDCSGKMQALTRYNERIAMRLEEHVQNYDLTPHPGDSKEIRARKEVQTGIAQIMTQLPAILYELKVNHFPEVRPKRKYISIRMYGEPCLPPEEITQKLFKRFKAQRISRRKTTYNLILFDVPVKTAPKVFQLDGTYLSKSKLVIRPAYINWHVVTEKENNAVKESTQIDATKEEDSSMAT